MSVAQDEINKCKEKEKELLLVLQVKAQRIANDYLVKNRHTQLSYLSKEEQEFNIAIPKGILMDKIIAYLRSVQ